MEISKEIIEKYHEGNCTPTEKELVENWLLNDEVGELNLDKEAKSTIKKEMWADISSFISEEEPKVIHIKKNYFFISDIRKIAAIIVFTLVSVAIYKAYHQQESKETLVLLKNSGEDLKKVDQHSYLMTMAPNSNAEIDLSKGLIDFCGSILFSPKEDLELNVNGYTDKIKFENGQTYIVLGNYLESNKIIVLNEKDILNLPPVIQRQLITQFNI